MSVELGLGWLGVETQLLTIMGIGLGRCLEAGAQVIGNSPSGFALATLRDNRSTDFGRNFQ